MENTTYWDIRLSYLYVSKEVCNKKITINKLNSHSNTCNKSNNEVVHNIFSIKNFQLLLCGY